MKTTILASAFALTFGASAVAAQPPTTKKAPPPPPPPASTQTGNGGTPAPPPLPPGAKVVECPQEVVAHVNWTVPNAFGQVNNIQGSNGLFQSAQVFPTALLCVYGIYASELHSNQIGKTDGTYPAFAIQVPYPAGKTTCRVGAIKKNTFECF